MGVCGNVNQQFLRWSALVLQVDGRLWTFDLYNELTIRVCVSYRVDVGCRASGEVARHWATSLEITNG